jgi:hypothetical protein
MPVQINGKTGRIQFLIFSELAGIRKPRANDSNAMIVIMNRGAGGPGDPQARIAELFRAHGATPRIVHPNGDHDIASVARKAAQSSERIVVAAGGDGTINGVAGELAGTDKILGVLPIGTLNHFAKDLRVPLGLQMAVRTVVDGRVVAVDAGEVNGRIFLNNSSLGIYPQFVSRREAQQSRLARGKWPAFFWATIRRKISMRSASRKRASRPAGAACSSRVTARSNGWKARCIIERGRLHCASSFRKKTGASDAHDRPSFRSAFRPSRPGDSHAAGKVYR